MEQLLDIPTSENEITRYFLKVRDYTEMICKPLETEDYVPQPMEDVSPPKWHLAHTTWFFEHFILKQFKNDYREFHQDFGFVFNSYYESAGKRVNRANRGDLSRPTVAEVYAYRDHVNINMRELLEKMHGHPDKKQISELLELGLNHEQQHQELLWADLKYILGNNPLMPEYSSESIEDRISPINNENESVSLEEGVYEVGFQGKGFSYDNEHGRHKVYLESFEANKNLVTNREYLNFIWDGGYKDYRHWLGEGWDFVNKNDLDSPLYWFKEEKYWYHYTLSGTRKVNLDEPVMHISFYEADAFARWKGMRLPTEFEWEAIHKQLNYGQLWEWTNSAYLPYPRYKKPEGPTGEYNGKFMVNQKVLRGGSIATPQGHFRATYRNFWHTDRRWQFNGFRLAKTL